MPIRQKKPSVLKQLQESKDIRLNTMKNKSKVEKIREIEQQWRKLALVGKLDDLLVKSGTIHNYIHGAASRWGYAYKKNRLSRDDFLSAFYQAAWEDAITKYTWATEFFLYELIVKAIQSRGKNLLRDCLHTDRRRTLHEALPLADGFEEFYADEDTPNMAEVVMDNLFREQTLLNTKLTVSERQILFIVFDDEKVSKRKLAKETGMDRRIVSQTMKRLRPKLSRLLD
jgi:hypothetical protein